MSSERPSEVRSQVFFFFCTPVPPVLYGPLRVGSATFHRERMYFAMGFGLIQCVKALMSYEDEVRFFCDGIFWFCFVQILSRLLH